MMTAVITGLSAVTPFGISIEDFRTRMLEGQSGVRSLDSIIRDEFFPVRAAGLLPEGFYPETTEYNFKGEIEILLNSTIESLFSNQEFYPFDAIIFGTNEGLARFRDFQNLLKGETLASHLEPEFGLRTIVSKLRAMGQPEIPASEMVICGGACTTGLNALHYASQRILSGRNRRVLVLCAESRVRIEELLKLNALGALSRWSGPAQEASRPFSRSRSGFVRGEGAGAVILEHPDFVQDRKVHGSLLGTAVTTDAWRLTDGREDLVCASRAIEKALRVSQTGKDQIDYINAHGTATLKNDLIETQVIKKVFGDRARQIPVSSLKSQIGHLNFACGIVEVIACLLMLESQRVAPTINLWDRDPDCDLDYVPNESRPIKLRKILKTGFGFGGANAALVLGRI